MLTINHKIKGENSIHARPVGLLASEAKKFNSDIYITSGEKKANAKKIFEVMGLCLKENEAINILIAGEDEKKAFDAMAVFLEQNL